MSGYLIDTNVISEFVKPTPNVSVANWFRAVESHTLFASVMTFGEISLGIENLPAGKRRADLELWLHENLSSWFGANLLPVTRGIAERWGKLTIEAKRKGLILSTADGLIAATALMHSLTLVTRNRKDFAGLGIRLLDPWDDSDVDSPIRKTRSDNDLQEARAGTSLSAVGGT